MKIKITHEDRLFSLYVRCKANWTCENLRCRRTFNPPTNELQNSHFHGRRKQSVRFDPENVAAICFSCHRHFTENPAEHVHWFGERLGVERYNALLVRANTPGKPDVMAIRIFCREEIKRMGYGHLLTGSIVRTS